jgi:DOMON domain
VRFDCGVDDDGSSMFRFHHPHRHTRMWGGPSLLLLGLLFRLGCGARVARAQQDLPDGALLHEDGVLLGGPHTWWAEGRDLPRKIPLPAVADARMLSEVGRHGEDSGPGDLTHGAYAHEEDRVSEFTGRRAVRALADEGDTGGRGGGEGNETMEDPSNNESSIDARGNSTNNNDSVTSDGIDCTFREALPLKHGFYSLKHVVNPMDGTIAVEFTFNEEGWVAFGTSPTGKMIGGEVVIAKPSEPVSSTNPGKYAMSGKRLDAVTLMDAQTLTNASWTQANGQTILRYTKRLKEEGELEIFPDGSNTFIFAAGVSNDFADHGLRFGKVTLSSLEKCIVPGHNVSSTQGSNAAGSDTVDSSSAANLWALHGILMGVAWAVLVPIGVGCSLVRSILPVRLVWFQLHKIANVAAFLLQTAAFGMAVYMTSQDNDGHFQGTHKSVGLAVYLVSFVQVLSGFFRPQLRSRPGPPVKFCEVSDDEVDDNYADRGDHLATDEGPPNSSATRREEVQVGQRVAGPEGRGSDECYAGVGVEDDDLQELPGPREISEKSVSRLAFEFGHRFGGFALVGLAWYNCSTGIDEMVAHYGPSYDMLFVLWGVVWSLCGLIVLLYVYQRCCWKGASRPTTGLLKRGGDMS